MPSSVFNKARVLINILSDSEVTATEIERTRNKLMELSSRVYDEVGELMALLESIDHALNVDTTLLAMVRDPTANRLAWEICQVQQMEPPKGEIFEKKGGSAKVVMVPTDHFTDEHSKDCPLRPCDFEGVSPMTGPKGPLFESFSIEGVPPSWLPQDLHAERVEMIKRCEQAMVSSYETINDDAPDMVMLGLLARATVDMHLYHLTKGGKDFSLLRAACGHPDYSAITKEIVRS